MVVCAGGGGIPVVADGDDSHGIEAVVDKDLASALLARAVGADLFVCLTDVDAVYDDWGTDQAMPIASATPVDLRARNFAAGSMGPKVEATCRFVEATGKRAAIGVLGQAAEIVAGRAGTSIVAGTKPATS